MSEPRLTVVIGANGANAQARRPGPASIARGSPSRSTTQTPSPKASRRQRRGAPARRPQACRRPDPTRPQRRQHVGFESTYSGRSRPDIVRTAKRLRYTRGPSSSEPRSSRSTSAAYARGWRKGDVSDDQTVDVIPVLPPRIKRSALEKAIAELETATADDYHSAINWLNRHKFYLNQEQCRRINAAIARIQKEPLEVGELRRVWKEFSPDPSLSDSYFESEDAEPASS